MAVHHNFFNTGRAGEESAFYTDAVAGDTPNREIGIIGAFPLTDDGTFEFLNSLVAAFCDPQKHTDIIPNTHLGDIWIFWSLHSF
jgi:hypothetical protein